MEELKIRSSLDYISKLELAGPIVGMQIGQDPEKELNSKGVVAGGSILTFVTNLAEQAKKDVLNSTLFAQLVANKQHDRFNEVREWYQKYTDVLQNLGWVIQDFSFSIYKENKLQIELDKAALKILQEIASGGNNESLEEILSVLEGANEDSESITILDASGIAGNAGNFQVGGTELDDDGNVSLSLGAFHFKTVEKKKKFLFIKWDKSKLQLFAATSKIVLNSEIYGMYREAVKERIKEIGTGFIASI